MRLTIILAALLLGLSGFTWSLHIDKVHLKEEVSNLKTNIEDLKRKHSVELESCNNRFNAAIRLSETTSRMEKISAKKPKLLQKRINDGFSALTDTIVEATK